MNKLLIAFIFLFSFSSYAFDKNDSLNKEVEHMTKDIDSSRSVEKTQVEHAVREIMSARGGDGGSSGGGHGL